MKDIQFQIIDKNGKPIICHMIATYYDIDTNQNFIVYTDKTLDENKNLNIYYSLYEKMDNKLKLIEITNQRDRRIGLELIKELLEVEIKN